MKTRLLLPLFALALVAGCSKSQPADTAPAVTKTDAPAEPGKAPAAGQAGSTADGSWLANDMAKTLKEQSDFYRFKTPEDFKKDTANLTWEDGSDLPEFADLNAKKGGTVNEWIPDFPATFRTNGPDSNDFFREYLLDYDELTLVYPHPNLPGKYYPQLAKRYAADPANKTVYFELPENATWSDGVPVTTDDLVFSFYFYRNPMSNEPWNQDFYTKTYTHITVYDKHTFAVSLPEARPDMVDRCGDFCLYAKHGFSDYGPGWVQRHDWMINPTTGAYTVNLAEVKKQVSVTLTHVKNWWAADKRFMRGRYNPDKVRCIVVRDPNKAIEEFLRGDLDMIPLNTPSKWYEKTAETVPNVANGWTVKAAFYQTIPVPDYGLWINQSKPYLSNQDVRVGIQYAANFDLVCKKFFRGDAVRQQTASDGYGWDVNPEVRARPFDPAKARECFAKAGFTKQGPDGILMNDKGDRLSFTITNTFPNLTDLLAILKQEALKAGLELNIETPDSTTAFNKCLQKQHDIAFMGFNRSVEAYPRYWEDMSSDNAYDKAFNDDGSVNPNRKIKTDTNNLCEYANFETDKLIRQYDHLTTMDEVKEVAAKLEKIAHDNAAWVPGWKVPFYRIGYRPWIKWPADCNPARSRDELENWTYWVDQDEQKKDTEMHEAGQALPKQILVFDQHKAQ